jgi:16S rRNA (cytosine1402-N4)-methyltransferase
MGESSPPSALPQTTCMAASPQPFDHQPVLLAAVLSALDLKPTHLYVDGTLGGAGHSLAMLKQCPTLNLIGLDRDPLAVSIARERLQNAGYAHNTQVINARFAELGAHVAPGSVTGGVLLDIGVSSPQLDDPARGFSFRYDSPLDMRMNPTKGQTAADYIAQADEAKLVNCFKTYGEERLARPIAQAILSAPHLPVTTTELANVVSQVYRRYRIKEQQHPATRVFQALRIAINGELDELTTVLAAMPTVLAPGARLAVITFHSLEDRIVKQWMAHQVAKCVCPPRLPICQCGKQVTGQLITRKPIIATPEEIATNPRSRSAKLRVLAWG